MRARDGGRRVILREEGIWRAGPAEVTTPGGRFSLTLGRSDACPTMEMMQHLDTLRVDSADLRALLGSVRRVTSASAVIAGTGLRHLLIPVGGAGDLAGLPMNPQVIEAVSSKFGVDTIGVYAVTQVGDRVVEVRMRLVRRHRRCRGSRQRHHNGHFGARPGRWRDSHAGPAEA
jgi:predicted PhzF superfamily epimerase YddE/YHI9